MKSLILSSILFAFTLGAQESVPPEKAREIAGLLGRLYPELKDGVFPAKPDLGKPHGVSGGDLGMIFVPEKGIAGEKFGDVGPKLIPLGVLWLHGLLPSTSGLTGIEEDQVRNFTVSDGKKRVVVHAFHVGIRKGERGHLQLELYGRGAEPLVTSRMLELPTKQTMPVELSVYGGDGDGGIALVSVAGRLQAEVRIKRHDAEPSGEGIELRSASVDTDKAVRAAELLQSRLNDFADAPVRLDGDVAGAVLFEINDVAALLVPQAGLVLDAVVEGSELPVGQLWLKGIVPEVGGKPATAARVKTIQIEAKGQEVDLAQFLLTVRKGREGHFDLLVYSQGKSALLRVPMKAVNRRPAGRAVEIEGREAGEGRGILTIVIGGRHAAEVAMRSVR